VRNSFILLKNPFLKGIYQNQTADSKKISVPFINFKATGKQTITKIKLK